MAEQATAAERSRADRAEAGREAERSRADALADQLLAVQQVRRQAEEALQAVEARWAADNTARRSLGRLARLRAAWRGE
jgi:hypothetical protein